MSNSNSGVPLGEVKGKDCLALSRVVMQKLGSTAQTVSALRRLANRDTGEVFARVEVIAELACLSVRTVKYHLQALANFGWIKKRGRLKRRRTVSYVIPPDLMNRKGLNKFVLLPRWAAKLLPSWGERCVFALILAHDALGERYGEDRSRYSIVSLCKDSGLTRPAVVAAKYKLAERGRDLIVIHEGTIHAADSLEINPDFRVPKRYLDDGAGSELVARS